MSVTALIQRILGVKHDITVTTDAALALRTTDVLDGRYALAVPIGKISIIRNDADRAALFSALAYQGFAVDRLVRTPQGAAGIVPTRAINVTT